MGIWWNRGRSTLTRWPRTKRHGKHLGRSMRHRNTHVLEPLEKRCLLTVTANLNGTVLEIFSDDADDVAVTVVGGDVKFSKNGGGAVDPTGGPLAANLVTALDITGYTGVHDNIVDLTDVTPTDFTSLATVTVDAGDGNDQTILGPLLSTSGNQIFNDPVVLTSDTLLSTTGALHEIQFHETVDGNGAGPWALFTVATSFTRFGDGGADYVGSVNPLRSLNTTGDVRFNMGDTVEPSVTTTENQTYLNRFVLEDSAVLDAGTGEVDFGGTVSGAFDLGVLNASTTTFRDNVTSNTAATSSANVVVNAVDAANVTLLSLGGSSQLQINSTTTVALPGLDIFTFEGGTGDDQLSVVGTGANPIPANGVIYNANGQTSTDRLFVSGDGTNSAIYTPDATTTGDGVVTVDGLAITFTGLEPIDITGMAVASVVTPNAVNDLTVTDGFDFATGAVPALRVAGTTGGVSLETAALWNNTLVNINTATVPGIDRVSINNSNAAHLNDNVVVGTGDGADQIIIDSVTVPTTLSGDSDNDVFFVTPSPSAVITVNGQPPIPGDPGVPPGDILALNLVGVTDAQVPPTGVTDGVVTSSSHGDVVFTSIETLIASDRFELNNTLATATVLGSEPEITLRDLSIHDADDEDFFKITANKTGKLIINAFFSDVVGDIDMQLLDANGNVLASSTSTTDNERIVVPVVSQEMYFLHVIGFSDAVNNYELEIENFAAPVPAAVFLAPVSDTGMLDNDNITNDITPRLFVLADLSDFANMGITVLNAAQATAGQTAGAAVHVFATDLATGVSVDGYADPVGGSNTLFTFTPAALPDGTYFITAAVDIFDLQEDGGGLPNPVMGRSLLSPPLTITIDNTPPAPSTVPDLLESSDSGTFNNDDVTNIVAPAFRGVGPANHKIRILASRDGAPLATIGQGVIGTDLTDAPEPNSLGAWEVTVEPLTDGTYEILAIVEDAAGNQSAESQRLTVTIDTITPNTPVLDLATTSDSGRSDTDDITNDNTPTVITTADDPFNTGTNPFPNDIRYRIFDRISPTAEVLLVDSFADLGSLTTGGVFSDVLPLLSDGVHNLKLEVEDRAGNLSHDYLLSVVIDTVAPPRPTINLDPASDTGIQGQPGTFVDRITSDSTPALLGLAEADSLVRVYADGVPISVFVINASDTFLGETVAVPVDGNQAFSNGQWALNNLLVDLNDPAFFPFDGVRQIGATAEDVAGNVYTGGEVVDSGFIDIFLDTQAPKVDHVGLVNFPGFDLFDPKPSQNGPTPPVSSIDIGFVDNPVRIVGYDYAAVNQSLATTIGNYELVGDHDGVIPIAGIQYIDHTVPGAPGTTTVRLLFNEPLPDDRFTLRVRDSISDEPGNALDGESGANAADDNPVFPSGDGSPGGDFVARFTVDSRPEIATYSDGSVFVDANGNYHFDPTNHDFSNRDLVFQYGFATDALFVGNFNNHGFAADGFDKLGAYGFVNGAWRWIIDTDNDGVANLNLINPLAIDGLPVAGNFNGFDIDGDEIGLFDGQTWYFDTNANDVIDAIDVQLPNSNMVGFPIAGDFDGDGVDDLGTYANGVFQFDFAWDGLDGQVDDTINFSFSGVLERPVAGDINLDGVDDIGLWVPGRSGQLPERAGEWYFLISERPNSIEYAGPPPHGAGNSFGTADLLDHPFSPQPLGKDLFAQFGDEFALPLFGNFDPPPSGGVGGTGAGVTQSTIGLFDPNAAGVFLRSENNSGVADAGQFTYGQPGWTAISGDFNGDGTQTVGVYDPATAMFFLSNSNESGDVDIPAFNFGMPGWTPLVGDWNGDGVDTVGVYNPATATFFLRNSNTTGVADVPAFNYGLSGWDPIVGDWDGSGTDTVGVYNSATATFFLRNSNTVGVADVPAFNYGASGWTPLAGDWNSDGVDSIGAYNGSTSTFFLRNSNNSGVADIPAFNYGPAGGGWQPLIGDWNGPSGSPLRLAGTPVLNSDAAALTDAALQPAVVEAIARWTTVGLNSSLATTLAGIDFRIVDLPGDYLGLAMDDLIYLDSDAAGIGWHIDPTDAEVMGVDLLSVVSHELGHTLGLGDLDPNLHQNESMAATLAQGVRRIPDTEDLLFGDDNWM